MRTRCYRFRLNLSYAECKEYYEGHYTAIKVMTHVGLTMQFPAHNIRNFVRSNGVNGLFELELDENNKFISLRKLSD